MNFIYKEIHITVVESEINYYNEIAVVVLIHLTIYVTLLLELIM